MVVANGGKVLILVLMEDTHWGEDFLAYLESKKVLILVLMEDTHWVDEKTKNGVRLQGLNPCFNGRYSLRRLQCGWWILPHDVLILVLMEDTHWVNAMNNFTVTGYVVLILVLMEDTHWGTKIWIF